MLLSKELIMAEDSPHVNTRVLTFKCSPGVLAGVSVRLIVILLQFKLGKEEIRGVNRRSSEIQGTALGKSLRVWTCTYRSMPAGVAQSRHAFVWGTVSTWGR